MRTTALDFEKPIIALEKKLADLKQNTQNTTLIKKLALEIDNLKKETFNNLTRWQRVQLARHPQRPYTLNYIENITEDFIAMYGDRLYGDDKAIVGGFGTINQKTMMFIGHQKGRNVQERKKRNFGMPNPEGYRKALRLMKIAEKFNKPIITFIDTPGAFPGLEAEERGQAEAIAKNIQTMFTLSVPILVIIIGEGASGGALGIGVGDKILMLENTWYSVISPESCSSILWKGWEYKEQAAEALKLTAKDMLAQKIIDEIIPEPLGGAHRSIDLITLSVKKKIIQNIENLEKIDAQKRILHRIEKFSNIDYNMIY